MPTICFAGGALEPAAGPLHEVAVAVAAPPRLHAAVTAFALPPVVCVAALVAVDVVLAAAVGAAFGLRSPAVSWAAAGAAARGEEEPADADPLPAARIAVAVVAAPVVARAAVWAAWAAAACLGAASQSGVQTCSAVPSQRAEVHQMDQVATFAPQAASLVGRCRQTTSAASLPEGPPRSTAAHLCGQMLPGLPRAVLQPQTPRKE